MYADMPLKPTSADRRLAEALPRIRAVMQQRGHTQKDVEVLTGVAQSQLSKLLGGRRRRVTPDVQRIFQYAGIGETPAATEHAELARLSRTIRRAVGNNTRRARLVIRVIEALAPTLALLDAAESAEEVTP
jgi:transcriptional regulator with XRE-family HTH domain